MATNAHQEVVGLDVTMDEVLVVNIPEEDMDNNLQLN